MSLRDLAPVARGRTLTDTYQLLSSFCSVLSLRGFRHQTGHFVREKTTSIVNSWRTSQKVEAYVWHRSSNSHFFLARKDVRIRCSPLSNRGSDNQQICQADSVHPSLPLEGALNAVYHAPSQVGSTQTVSRLRLFRSPKLVLTFRTRL